MSACLSNVEIERYTLGTLGDRETRRIREHLSDCEHCRASLEQHRSIQATCASDAGSVLDVTTPVSRDAVPLDTSPEAKLPRHLPQIDGYRITGVLGQGGMGIVYRAVQAKLNRAVALKVLPAIVGSASPAAVSRFQREARSAARLHHTNIVPIYDYGESRDAYYYAMELIDGVPLNELVQVFCDANVTTLSPARLTEILHQSLVDPSAIAPTSDLSQSSVTTSQAGLTTTSTGRGRAYFRQVARWIGDAADALHYAHGAGIIHRDIKPANMILAKDGRIMITDFGLAKSTEDESVTVTGSLLGTVRYLSPEQAMAGRIAVDHRTDIYSLGATMYELLCFQPAFPGTEEKQVLAAIMTRDPMRPRKILHSVPAELETICLKALERSPDQRYDTGRAFAEDLSRFLNDLPIVAQKPSVARRMGKFAKRHRALVVGAIALVLVAAVSALWYREQIRSREAEVDTYLAEGERLLQEESWTDAVAQYDFALQLDPDNVAALGNMVKALMELYENEAKPDSRLLDAAQEYCQRALALEPDRPRLANIHGSLLSLLGDYDGAIAVFDKEIADNPDEPWTLFNRAAVDFLRGAYEEAETRLARAADIGMALDPPYCHALRELASLQLLRGNAEAAKTINKAIDCGVSGFPYFHFVHARIRLSLTECYDPVAALSAATVADDYANRSEPAIKRYLALAYLRKGDPAAAATQARLALKLNGLSCINHLIVAIAEAKLAHPAAAKEAFDIAIEAWPDDLREPGSSRLRLRWGMLWFETADEHIRLRKEAESLLKDLPVQP